MSPQHWNSEKEQALRRRLPKFNRRTRQLAAVLTRQEEIAGSVTLTTSSGSHGQLD